jgi:hypothetical protein
MTLLLTAFVMFAFAGVYALLFAMLGSRMDDLAVALAGPRRPRQSAKGSSDLASRRLSLA